jgi:hypothetical protein
MRAVLLTATLVVSSAFGQDFRGTRFGESCGSVVAREIALGSRQVPWSNPSPEKLTFEGTALGRRSYILYLCPNGILAIGDYHYPKGRYQSALADFKAVLTYFRSLYGSPAFLSEAHPSADWPPEHEPSRDRQFSTAWFVGDLHVSNALVFNGTSGPAEWETVVVIDPVRAKPRSN